MAVFHRLRRVGPAGAALAVLLVAAAGCSSHGGKAGAAAASPVTVLHLVNVNGFPDSALQAWADAVDRRSRGSLRIDIMDHQLPGVRLQERHVIENVRSGRSQLAWVGARAWDAVGVKSFAAIVAPFLVDSYALQQKVVASPLAGEMLAGVRPLGVVGLAVLPGPMRWMFGPRPLARPADFAGLRFATTVSLAARATFRALGARPVSVPADAKLTAREGLESQLSGFAGNRYDRVDDYLTANLPLWPRPLVVFANRKTFDSLSASQQAALRSAVSDALRPPTSAHADDAYAQRQLCTVHVHEVRLSPPQVAALRQAVEPVYRTLAQDPQTRSLLRRIEALKRMLGAPTAAVPRCRAAAPTPTADSRTSLDGVYHRHVSEAAEAKFEHAPIGYEQPGNWGDFVLVVDRGRFAFTQWHKNVCTWQYGKQTLKGKELDWNFTDGRGIGTDSYNKPGEYFVQRWNFYRDTLTIRPISPADAPTQVWQRTSTTPSRQALGHRCPPPKGALP